MSSSPGGSSPALFHSEVHLDVGVLPEGVLEDSELVRGTIRVPRDINVI